MTVSIAATGLIAAIEVALVEEAYNPFTYNWDVLGMPYPGLP